MKLKARLFYVFILVGLLSPAAFAWWTEGHHCIDRAAVSVLPADVPEFFRQGADTIASYSMDPDLWKNRDLPTLMSAEYSNHYLDLELFKGKELPETRAGYFALCRELKLDPDAVGTLPYAIQEWQDRLVLAFSEHRMRPADKAVQAKVLYIAGVLSHYTGDASQPLHCTVHHDGRARPDGTSPRTGIHLKMDALPGQLGVQPEEVAERLQITVVEDVFAAVVAVIKESGERVDHVYELEDRLPPAEGPVEGEADGKVVALALDCCRAGAELTAALWCSAWVQSENVKLPE